MTDWKARYESAAMSANQSRAHYQGLVRRLEARNEKLEARVAELEESIESHHRPNEHALTRLRQYLRQEFERPNFAEIDGESRDPVGFAVDKMNEQSERVAELEDWKSLAELERAEGLTQLDRERRRVEQLTIERGAATNRAKALERERDDLRARVAELEADRRVHHYGTCVCSGRGECRFCVAAYANRGLVIAANNERDEALARVAALEMECVELTSYNGELGARLRDICQALESDDVRKANRLAVECWADKREESP